MSVAIQYHEAKAWLSVLKPMSAAAEEMYSSTESASVDNLQDHVGAICDNIDEAIASCEAVINNIDGQGGVDAVDAAMAAESKMDLAREEWS